MKFGLIFRSQTLHFLTIWLIAVKVVIVKDSLESRQIMVNKKVLSTRPVIIVALSFNQQKGQLKELSI